MASIGHNTSGGGAKTNKNGKAYEKHTMISKVLQKNSFEINKKDEVWKNNVFYGYNVPQGKIYKKNGLLNKMGINWEDHISKKWQPDECFVNINTKTIYIIEKKFQEQSGSVDEKLATCDFKKREYKKLFSKSDYKVEYIYFLCDWFKSSRYKDYIDYIIETNCKYYIGNDVPNNILEILGIDEKKEEDR